MGLSDEDRRELTERFRRELEADLLDAEARRKARKERHDRRKAGGGEAAREAEIMRLRLEVAQDFYTERGYVRYEDSRGRVSWITADQAKRRRRRKRRHGRRTQGPPDLAKRTVAIYVAILVLAVVVGLALGAGS